MCRPPLVALLLFGVVMAGCSEPPPQPMKFSRPQPGTSTNSHLKIGDAFPKLEAVDLEGNPVVFDESIRGERYTLVVFWSTWCGFCMQELPHEIELAKRYEQDGLRVIGINADTTREEALAAVEDHGIPWLNLYEGREMAISRQLGISSWPHLYLLDSEGKVVSSSAQMRAHTATHMETGEIKKIYFLDFTLENLLRGSEGETLYP